MFNPERPPEIIAQRWLNSDTKRTLKAEKGKVVVIAIWQLACPGSQKFGLPQAMRLRGSFTENEVAVLGLHMAFEKFDEQTPEKVEAFLAENGITIPVALDKPTAEGIPETMKAYELQGTPALLIFDRQGRLRRHYLGAVDDFRLGAEVMALLIEDKDSPREMSIALERKLAAALVDPEANHEHGDSCGCGHDHSHDHGHGHHHHDHGHSHDHDHAAAHGEPGHVHGPGCKH
ncbi:TlpA disulfide reductase family protein [Hyphomicrobium sp. 99]|uniref:TlpA disulfide reductase family protein n=1 Tax=Hyphomicrobium sp. 99 TaxID=1163419 RepID=UPI0005F82E4E|nr:TlpA disulfide reductase family protein [Hyphomicrobium sp. 99]